MMLPLLLSIPHAGLDIPAEVEKLCILTSRDIIEDSDAGASEIYSLEQDVAGLATTRIARAIVDLNRAEDDFRPDGVIKTHTCFNKPVYRGFPDPELQEKLLSTYYRPYHGTLSRLAAGPVILGLDCHTMAAAGPSASSDPGRRRPLVCLSNGNGTCPREWFHAMAACLSESFETQVSLNRPFKGGHIIHSHARELPWMQLELSRTRDMKDSEKRRRLLAGLTKWCREYDKR